MPAWLDAITSPLSAASEGVQKLIEMRDLIKFGDALGKLQAQILSAQQGALAGYARELALLEEIGTLKTRVTDLEAWSTQKQRYERRNVGYTAFAYVLKKSERGTETPHWACTNCYEHGKIVTLQYGRLKDKGPPVWRCPSCKNEIDPGVATADWPQDG
jgi:rubrerythrin